MSTDTSRQDSAAKGRELLLPIFTAQKKAFAQRPPRTCAERVDALDALMSAILRYEDALVDSLIADFSHRAPQETRLLEYFRSLTRFATPNGI